MSRAIELSEKQQSEFRRLWFIYGNSGKKSTLFNHKLIQGFIEGGEDRREDYADVNKNLADKYGKEYAIKNGITDECLAAVNNTINGI